MIKIFFIGKICLLFLFSILYFGLREESFAKTTVVKVKNKEKELKDKHLRNFLSNIRSKANASNEILYLDNKKEIMFFFDGIDKAKLLIKNKIEDFGIDIPKDCKLVNWSCNEDKIVLFFNKKDATSFVFIIDFEKLLNKKQDASSKFINKELISSGSLTPNGVILVSLLGSVSYLDFLGSEVWKQEFFYSKNYYSRQEPQVIDLESSKIFLASTDEVVTAIDLKTGSIMEHFNCFIGRKSRIIDLAIREEDLYALTTGGLFIFNKSSGTLKEKILDINPISRMLFIEDLLVFHDNKNLFIINLLKKSENKKIKLKSRKLVLNLLDINYCETKHFVGQKGKKILSTKGNIIIPTAQGGCIIYNLKQSIPLEKSANQPVDLVIYNPGFFLLSKIPPIFYKNYIICKKVLNVFTSFDVFKVVDA